MTVSQQPEFKRRCGRLLGWLLALTLALGACQNNGVENTLFSCNLPSPLAVRSSLVIEASQRAYTLDSLDYRLFHDWETNRLAEDSLRAWLPAHYWQLQFLTMRLHYGGVLFNTTQQQAARFDSAMAIAGDLARILNDSLMLKVGVRYQHLPSAERTVYRDAVLAYHRGRMLYENSMSDSASAAFNIAREVAARLGDFVLELDARLGLLDVIVLSENYERVTQESQQVQRHANSAGYWWAQAQALNLLGEALRVQDRDREALAASDSALAIAMRMHDTSTQRRSHFYAARTLLKMNHTGETEQRMRAVRALDFYREFEADLLLMEADILQGKGEFGPAIEPLEQAENIFRGRAAVAELATCHAKLSQLHFDMGDFQNALAFELAARRHYESTGNSRRIAWSDANLATIYSRLEQYDLAAQHFEQAIRYFEQSEEQRQFVSVLLDYASMLLRIGKRPKAVTLLQKASDLANQLDYDYGRTAVLLLSANHAFGDSALALADSLYRLAETAAVAGGHTTLQTEAIYGQATIHRQQRDFAAALADLERAIVTGERRLRAINRDSLRTLYFATTQDLFDAAILLARQEGNEQLALAYIERASARALKEMLGERVIAHIAASAAPSTELSSLQRRLPAENAVIQYRLTDEALLLWIVSQDTLISRTIPVTRDAVANTVEQFLKSIGAFERSEFLERIEQDDQKVYEENRRLGRILFDMLVAPYYDALRGKRQLLIIADGLLHHLPFGALLTPAGEFLEAEFVVAKTPALSLLARQPALAEGDVPLQKQVVLALGNPRGDLRYAANEMQAIAQSFVNSRFLEIEQATFAALQAALQSGVPMLHFSTHAYADPLRPLNSYVEMSTTSATRTKPKVERVYAARLLELDLSQTKQVVLNGCETAVGTLVRGEGALNLVRLFMIKDVPIVIASLWQNDDRISAFLMADYYHELSAGNTPIESLHSAKLKLIQEMPTRFGIKYPLPYFWAAFEIYINRQILVVRR